MDARQTAPGQAGCRPRSGQPGTGGPRPQRSEAEAATAGAGAGGRGRPPRPRPDRPSIRAGRRGRPLKGAIRVELRFANAGSITQHVAIQADRSTPQPAALPPVARLGATKPPNDRAADLVFCVHGGSLSGFSECAARAESTGSVQRGVQTPTKRPEIEPCPTPQANLVPIAGATELHKALQ